ncbi:MAG: hypothetical protein KDA68_17220 [Planctomycetaceae bacterium]|nr:hypothetical protein [Planctomycetaceae bacterium]
MSSSVSQSQSSVEWDQNLPISMELVLTVSDPEIIAELYTRNEGRDRDEYALAALRLGVLALRQARGQLDANILKREGEQLLTTVKSALIEHQSQIQQHVSGTLSEYFNPKDGRFTERVDRLLKKDGELETLLGRTLTGDQSDLQRVLTSLVGTDSPLFRLLSPEESNGLLSALREAVNQELLQQRQRVLDEFSLDNKTGAMSRLVSELTDSNGRLRDDMQEKIDLVVKEFSLDEENSALSRLVRQVEQAQKIISSEFSLDNDSSALSRMKAQVESTNSAISKHLTLDDETSALSTLRKQLMEILKDSDDRHRVFQEEVKIALEKMQARKAESARSTQHGVDFESQLFELIQEESNRSGDIATQVGATNGVLNRKVGDIVVEVGCDHVAEGAKVVIEAKEHSSYNIKKALDELDEAIKNRESQCGIFVFSKRTAPQGLEPLSRHGRSLIAVWDSENRESDLFVRLGLSVAKALCTRQARERNQIDIDFSMLDRALEEICKQVDQIDSVNTLATTIRNNGEKIVKQVQKSKESLLAQVEILQTTLQDLRQKLESESG